MSKIEIDHKEPKYAATLVRGEHYSLRDFAWDRGRTLVIGESHMVHLETHAQQVFTVHDSYYGTTEAEFKDMFKFEPYDGDEAIGYRFPTQEEVDAKAATVKSRDRARRIALARMEPGTATAPRARFRAR